MHEQAGQCIPLGQAESGTITDIEVKNLREWHNRAGKRQNDFDDDEDGDGQDTHAGSKRRKF